ncbi:MAG TPA: metal ABC transporter permease, partial [Myxococcota bacterium]|nr:metal ABC transporter permease [Myxococcota bacterium]
MMSEIFSHMLWPLLACLVLVGIHAYLGIHIIARKVIFVDLALAQIAGLGAVYAVYIGLSLESDTWLIKAMSIGFTLLGALLFAFTQKNDNRVPHEAIIGIIYAGALSMTVLLTANLPHGADEVQQMLAGNILWVTPKEVMLTALLYAFVGAVHIILRKPFFALSNAIAHGQSLSFKQRLWDFLFYATFGVVVTSSVGIGGVLLVFGYLVIPSVMAVMIADSTKTRLVIAWGSGIIVSMAGVVLSYHLDLPSGPTIVVLMAACLVIVSIIATFNRSPINALWQLSLLIVMLCLLAIPYFWAQWGSSLKEQSDARRHMQNHNAAHEGELLQSVIELLASKDMANQMAALQEIKEHRLLNLMPRVKP